MAKFLSQLKGNGNEYVELYAPKVTALPTASSANAGYTVFLNTSDSTKGLYWCDGTAWHKHGDVASAAVTLTKGSSGLIYTLKQGGATIGTISIPEDIFIEDAKIISGTWSDDKFTPSDTGKDIALAMYFHTGTASKDPVYVNVKKLIDIYSGGTTSSIQVNVDGATNKITADIVGESITLDMISTAAKNSLQSSTVTAPVASSTQVTAGTKSNSSLFQTIINNIAKLFADLANKVSVGNTDYKNVQSDWNATSGYAQILNKPTIPTVNNGTLTIQAAGTTKGTFTANQSTSTTINITKADLGLAKAPNYYKTTATGSSGTILATTHLCGVAPIIQAYLDGEQVLVDITINSKGDVTWAASTTISGSSTLLIVIVGL